MKENVLDILMYLFENYMDEEEGISTDPESLKTELVAAGFPEVEIDKAFAWLEGLSQLQKNPPRLSLGPQKSIRVFNHTETKKLATEARGFLLFLDRIGVLDETSRELVIDRVMALEHDEIELEQLKWVVLMVLFNQPGREAAYTWMEDMVFQEMEGNLH